MSMFDFMGLGELFKTAQRMPEVLLVELKDFFEALQQNAPKRWIPAALNSGPCTACDHPCFLICEICKSRSCMEHAFINHEGQAICLDCIEDAVILVVPRQKKKRPRFGRARDPRRPRKDDIAWALGVLNIPPGSSFEHCKAVYRKLAFELHPDRHQNDPLATGRFRELQKAYDILRTYHEAAPRASA